MMTKPVIEVSNLSKRYRLGTIGATSLKEDLHVFLSRLRKRKEADPGKAGPTGNQPKWVWALRDIDFKVQQGEALGFVGGNGAGKSTLLKILSRITEPTAGEAKLRGRVASLLEVGTGMHPDLTGRENIFLNAAILGMPRQSTRRKMDAIIEFSGISEFIDTPVKRYSSGMRVRLAFAVAAFLDADILIADEILAVGDAEFQKKCLGKMNEVAKGGRTVLFVSHDLAAVQNLCSRVIALRKGVMIADDSPQLAIQAYLNAAGEQARLPVRKAAGSPTIVSASASQGVDTLENLLTAGKPAHFRLQTAAMVRGAYCVIEIYNANFVLVTRFGCEKANLGPLTGDVALTCTMDPLRLSPGRYRLAGSVYVNDRQVEHIEHLLEFEVAPGWVDGFRVNDQRWSGLVKLPHTWEISTDRELSALKANHSAL
jgi:lipopolysaccharide transport system ATP-binding protein